MIDRKLNNKKAYEKIKIMSNALRFRILELTQEKELNITELSSILGLSYTKCADYVRMLERFNLISKKRYGKEVKVKSKIRIMGNRLLVS